MRIFQYTFERLMASIEAEKNYTTNNALWAIRNLLAKHLRD